VLLAKKGVRIKAARPVLEVMRASGMYLSDAVLNQAVALVGE
jgi:predicted nucleic acid-binding protein